MAQKLTKLQVERRVFEFLAPLVGFDVVAGSIQQGNPPLPDIECQIVDSGLLAIELVALDHADTRTRLSNMASTRGAWDQALSRRSPAEQATLHVQGADVFLGLTFAEQAGARDRTAAMKWVQDQLLVRAPGFTGDLLGELHGPAGLERAVVYRGSVTNGPQFSPFSAGSWLPPQIDKIREKLVDKRYQTTAPLELFAYALHDEPDGAVGVMEQIDTVVHAHLPGSRFRRVHVFHYGFGRLIRTYPC
jgi:hypothetical protein